MSLKEWRCFQHVQWNPDRAELRRFAFVMLIGFGLIGAVAAWRGHGIGTATWVWWTLGVLLCVGGLIPATARATFLAVYLPSSVAGFVISHVLLTVVFACCFVPLGALLRLIGKDPLALRPPTGASSWAVRPQPPGIERYSRQF